MNLIPGQLVQRLTSSTTGRNIGPGDIGSVGGINPGAWMNPGSFNGYEYFPVQWFRSGLWSSLDPFDEGAIWKPYQPAQRQQPQQGQQLDEEEF